MKIMIANTADIDEITRVEIDSKLHSFPHLIEACDINFDTRAYRWETWFAGQSPVSARPERIMFKVVDNSKIIGYLAIQLTTRFDMDAEIQSFFVLKGYQRKGVGCRLLKSAVNWTIANHVQSLCIGILPANPYRAFYLKYGGRYLNEHWIVWDDVNLLKALIC
jgi:predicted acetyltransferase